MKDPNPIFDGQDMHGDGGEPGGALKKALYLWERQPPSAGRSHFTAASPEIAAEKSAHLQPDIGLSDAVSKTFDTAIEEQLKRHATRLAALEPIIPNDRRLDPPRFSLMMLNAFLGRAVTEGIVSARLPGLLSICDRIDAELSDLETEYPAALERKEEDPDQVPFQIRNEMRTFFAELKSTQKAQQRQIVTSLTALHAAMTELQSRLPDADHLSRPSKAEDERSVVSQSRDDFADALIDPERLVDPRPVLAAARAAASQAIAESSRISNDETRTAAPPAPAARPYRTVLLGSAVLGLLMILFGREAAQFFTSSPMSAGALSRP